MTRRKPKQDEGPGQDSFLDIVANLVGIMIILVIVIGVRAKGEMSRTAPVLSVPVVQERDVEAAASTARSLAKGVQDLQDRVHRQAEEIEYRKIERDKKLMLVAALEKELEARSESMGEQEQQLFSMQRAIAQAQSELEKINAQVDVLKRDEEQVEVVRHLPTPMAKTVFGKEVHFQLKNGLLTYVPWNELVERLKEDARENVWKLKNSPTVTETLGPVRNFMMKYTLVANTQAVPTRSGTAVQNRVELESFELFPVERRGELVDDAMRPNSEFNAILAGHTPARSTVTVWVYPDSFQHYRKLQKALYDRGFLSAARPMPEDAAIGGSPKGTRTAAQ